MAKEIKQVRKGAFALARPRWRLFGLFQRHHPLRGCYLGTLRERGVGNGGLRAAAHAVLGFGGHGALSSMAADLGLALDAEVAGAPGARTWRLCACVIPVSSLRYGVFCGGWRAALVGGCVL